MTRTKIDNRIRVLIENGIKISNRTMFVVVGDKARDQVMILHHILTKAAVRARPSVLWCYKKELGFSSFHLKKVKKVKHKIKGGQMNINEDDPFELFIASANVRFCYYKETQKILGQTFGLCVLQDFEAITPNVLARTIETVEGGGLIIVLLKSLTSLKQLCSMAMDVHERYRTEAHTDIVGRFNERFLLSLSSCNRCVVVDDTLKVLPISSHVLDVSPILKEVSSATEKELQMVKESLRDTPPVGQLVDCCKTADQAKAVLKCIDAISEKSYKITISITAARGRGKSAALGLAVAAAVAFGYSNIFVTSPSPDNLKTFFEFVFKGFDALGYEEHIDYGLVQSTNVEHNKALIRVNVFRTTRQTIQYINPTDAVKLSHAELVVIDEAAAIPLPYVKNMFGPYLIFLSSTINGYEGTGRSLSLKLLKELRMQSANQAASESNSALNQRTLYEIQLEESIRYRQGDAIEKWLTDLLCLDATNAEPTVMGTPPPNDCELYYINRDTLFCYHRASEAFLHKIMALYVSSHYKNSPNDLQLMSDAPAHHLFCLLGPVDPNQTAVPDALCVIQMCLEGQVSSASVSDALTYGKKPTGDLIPWTVAQQFQDQEFPTLCGARIVRIATHPDYQSMGYGSRALDLLKAYFDLKMPIMEVPPKYDVQDRDSSDENEDLHTEQIEPRAVLPPLLLKLNERPPERLNYLGVSFGVTHPLMKFWKRAGFVTVYLRQTPNDITGEHSCIMIRTVEDEDSSWLNHYWADFKRRYLSLLSYQFRTFSTTLAVSVVSNHKFEGQTSLISKQELDYNITSYDIKRLELYSNNLTDYHLIMDLIPAISRLYFLKKLGDLNISPVQIMILLGLGLQHKTVDDLAIELDMKASHVLSLFNKIMRKIHRVLTHLTETAVEESLGLRTEAIEGGANDSSLKDLSEELENFGKAEAKKEKKKINELLKGFAIKGTDEEWASAIESNKSGSVSIRSELKKNREGTSEFEPPKKKNSSFRFGVEKKKKKLRKPNKYK